VNILSGKLAEERAAVWLTGRGYRIVVQNWRARFGEIDIVALHEGALVFVEVKYRKGMGFGRPEEYVTVTKRRRLFRAVGAYLTEHPFTGPMRFEVLAITGDERMTLLPDLGFDLEGVLGV
jgi:putative endonuclease